jgi:hypothetical protein
MPEVVAAGVEAVEMVRVGAEVVAAAVMEEAAVAVVDVAAVAAAVDVAVVVVNLFFASSR